MFSEMFFSCSFNIGHKRDFNVLFIVTSMFFTTMLFVSMWCINGLNFVRPYNLDLINVTYLPRPVTS